MARDVNYDLIWLECPDLSQEFLTQIFSPHLMFWTRYDLHNFLKMYVTSGIKLVYLRKGDKYFTGAQSWESPPPHDMEAFLYFPQAQ